MRTIIALMGKSGSGKDAILRLLADRHPDWNVIIPYTTRPKREGEIEGKDYYFVSEEEFVSNVENMFEITKFNDWYYGTTENSIEEGINIGVFNPYGCNILTSNNTIETLQIYIYCPSKTRLLRQLNREENPDVNEIIRRYTTDEEDFKRIEPDFTIINDSKNEILSVVYEIEQQLQDVGIS